MNRKALMFLNPRSGRAGAGTRALVDRLSEHFELDVHWSTKPAAIRGVMFDRRGWADCVIIGGGDGSCNAAADPLVDANLPLGILPLGTANDLARTLQIPTDLRSACDVIIAGHVRRIDLGWLNGSHFFNVASMGLSVKVTRRLRREGKGMLGFLAYWWAAAQAVASARPFQATITSEGRRYRVRTMQIAVGNGRHYGGGMVIDQQAQIDDGLLHLNSLEVARWWQLIPLVWRFPTGTFADLPNVRNLSAASFRLEPLRRQRNITVDGEIKARSPAHFRVVPQCLSVIVPSPSAPS